MPDPTSDPEPTVRPPAVEPEVRDADSPTLYPPSTARFSPRRSPAEPAPVPDSLAGYKIISLIGSGAMGHVYRCYHPEQPHVHLALKTLRPDPSASLLAFKGEFRTLANVTHPNLVKLHGLSADGPDWCLVMELVEGIDFLAHLKADPAEPRVRAAFAQLAAGVAALHAAGVLHRDLKPGNVLVTPAGRVVVLDFGLAGEMDARGRYDMRSVDGLGTASYMAPEQAAGTTLTPAADWYAVGVMLFEVLAGRRPFAGSVREIMAAKQNVEPPPVRTFRPDAPADLADLCDELLARVQEGRPHGADVVRRFGGAAPAGVRAKPFVGRVAAQAVLADALADVVARRRPRAVFVGGPSGVGKTHLVHQFLDGPAAAAEAVVLGGRCFEAEAVPFKAVDGAVDALVRHLGRLPVEVVRAVLPPDIGPLARVFPTIREVTAVAPGLPRAEAPADPQDARRRAFADLRGLLARLADLRPLVVVIDDL